MEIRIPFTESDWQKVQQEVVIHEMDDGHLVIGRVLEFGLEYQHGWPDQQIYCRLGPLEPSVSSQ